MIHHFLRIATLVLIVLAATGTEAVPNLDRVIATQLEEVAERPTDAMVHNDLGNLLVLAERLDEAESAYRKAKDLSPGDTSVRFNLGLLLQQQERFEEALDELNGLIEIDANHAWAHYQLGMIESDRGNRREALSFYAKSFALDPTLTFVRNNPHIIDNELATEALLRSSDYRSSAATSVPRSYSEGARLRELMLEEELLAEEKAAMEAEMAAEAEKSGEEAAEEGYSSTGTSSLGSRGTPETETPLPPRSRSVGEEESGDASQIGGVSVGVAPSGRPVSGEPVRRAEPSRRPSAEPPSGIDEQSRREAIRERLRGRRGGSEEPRDVNGGRVIGTPEGEDAPPVPRYRPSRRSTASLHLEILDEAESEPLHGAI